MSSFGEYIRAARLQRGWTLRESASKTGLAHSRLHELERGISSKTGNRVIPTPANIEGIALGYDLPVDQLFALAYFPGYLRLVEGLSPEELIVLDLYRALFPARQQLWLSIGEGLKALPPEGH
ncbi:MAG TPA: helix-turn-helix transcriptional regulator [Chroococcales cyanobacterium]